MKRYHIFFLALCSSVLTVCETYAQSNENYVRVETMLTPVTTQVAVDALSVSGKTTVYDYFDELGRPVQQVVMSGSPMLKDVVKPVAYDKLGRQQFDYLPYVSASKNGTYKVDALSGTTGYTDSRQYIFYQGTGKVVSDTKPYGENSFEPSPLNRALKSYAAGQAWGNPSTGGGNKPIAFSYGTNAASEVISWEIHDDGTLSVAAGGYYGPTELYKSTTTDEEGNKIIEYTDKRGRVILKKVQTAESPVETRHAGWACTYYVYDVFDNLRVVLPPEALRLLTLGGVAAYELSGGNLLSENKTFGPLESGDANVYYYTHGVTVTMSPGFTSGEGFRVLTFIQAPTQQFLDMWAFQYKYDGRKRMIEKKVPGAKPVYMVYDNRDRLVLTQDGNQRDASVTTGREWTFTKYDALNRPIMTGIYTHGSVVTQAMMSGLVSTTVFYESYNGSGAYGYTNTVFPTTAIELHTVTYYDTYDFKNLLPVGTFDYRNNLLNGIPSLAFSSVKDLVTGTWVRVLGGNDFMASVNYYDKYYRVVQNVSHNAQLGIDIMTNFYDFPGRVLKTKTNHNYGSVSAQTILREFEYDHAGRLEKIWHTYNGGTPVLLSTNEYNEIGELIDKKLHSEDNGISYAQSVDYRYNIRGWLTRINNSGLSESESQADNDYFGMELGYNNALTGVSATPVYNGNISAVKWSEDLGDSQRGYAFNYDQMNRITGANHFKNNASTSHFGISGVGYDLNGNIKTLTRKDEAGDNMDVLSYDYGSGTTQSNQLLSVSDAGNNNEGFRDGNTLGSDYLYDANGNMTKDLNKGLSDIIYNHLNLPQRVEKDTVNYILYTYEASGTKLRQQVYENGALVKTTDYVGEYIYENGELQLVQHEEGRIVFDPATEAPEYQYHLKDHLGNNRVTFTTKPKTIEFTANYENDPAVPDDLGLFEKVDHITLTSNDLFDHTDATGTTYTHTQRLTGGLNSQIGSVIAVPVGMGDTLHAEVFAKYKDNSGNGNNSGALALANLLVTAFTGGTGYTNELGNQSIHNNFQSGTLIGTTGFAHEDSDAPMAFLNVMFLPEGELISLDSAVSFAYDQIDAAAQQPNASVKATHDRLHIDNFQAPGNGYVLVYLSNESSVMTEVYFDDLKITVNEHPVIQTDNYYPFGLTHGNGFQRVTSLKNDFLFTGKERINDLDLSWYDFGARMYNSSIGRWHNLDPYADKYFPLSPFAYVANDPISWIDPDGKQIINPQKFVLSNKHLIKALNKFDKAVAKITGQKRSDFTFTITGGDRYKKDGKIYSATDDSWIKHSHKNSRHLRERGGLAVDVRKSKFSDKVLKKAAKKAGLKFVSGSNYTDGHFHMALDPTEHTQKYLDDPNINKNYIPGEADFALPDQSTADIETTEENDENLRIEINNFVEGESDTNILNNLWGIIKKFLGTDNEPVSSENY
ncbi:DUF6443 domain-containing protein [Fulvivirga sp. M361]|uniref:DUF6443 domain-containing protein n=1 Tax=Fulvivirga sp. M361 TaxID=2594266 RepID=UPI00162599E1|nr:DUF6443 domain-containing protein [Fulvivirga sp. M361]